MWKGSFFLKLPICQINETIIIVLCFHSTNNFQITKLKGTGRDSIFQISFFHTCSYTFAYLEIVEGICEKKNPETKGFSTVFGPIGHKELQIKNTKKSCFFLWRPKWPPKPINGTKSFIFHLKGVIWVSKPMFDVPRSPFWSK